MFSLAIFTGLIMAGVAVAAIRSRRNERPTMTRLMDGQTRLYSSSKK